MCIWGDLTIPHIRTHSCLPTPYCDGISSSYVYICLKDLSLFQSTFTYTGLFYRRLPIFTVEIEAKSVCPRSQWQKQNLNPSL